MILYIILNEISKILNKHIEDTRKSAAHIAAEVKKILLLKHKLIFYLSFLKEQDDNFYKEITQELLVFRAKDV